MGLSPLLSLRVFLSVCLSASVPTLSLSLLLCLALHLSLSLSISVFVSHFSTHILLFLPHPSLFFTLSFPLSPPLSVLQVRGQVTIYPSILASHIKFLLAPLPTPPLLSSHTRLCNLLASQVNSGHGEPQHGSDPREREERKETRE